MKSADKNNVNALAPRRAILMSVLAVLLIGWIMTAANQPPAPVDTPVKNVSTRTPEQEEALAAVMVQLLIEAEEVNETPEPDEAKATKPSKMTQATPVTEPAKEQATSVESEPAQSSEMDDVGEGRSPAIRGRFDVPVLDYLAAVEHKAGGRLVVWDKMKKQAVGEVINGDFKPTAT